MFRPEIMTDVESFAYFGAKLALKQKREREEQQRQFRLAEAERQRQVEAERQRLEAERQRLEAERQRLEAERRRQEELARLPTRKTERIQMIQRRKDELTRQIATYNAEIENINNLGLDEYNALYPPNFEPRTTPLNIVNTISDSDSDVDIDYYMGPALELLQRSVQQPVQRPVQQPPVQRPVQQPVARPVVQPVQPAPARPVQQPVARPLTTREQIHQLINQSSPRPQQQPVARQRRSSTYARENLEHDTILVQTLRGGHRMVVRYDRLNDIFIRLSNNATYQTLNRASAAHAEEVGLASTPNPWTTFNRLNGSSIDNR
jgi:hypothetical protein